MWERLKAWYQKLNWKPVLRKVIIFDLDREGVELPDIITGKYDDQDLAFFIGGSWCVAHIVDGKGLFSCRVGKNIEITDYNFNIYLIPTGYISDCVYPVFRCEPPLILFKEEEQD